MYIKERQGIRKCTMQLQLTSWYSSLCYNLAHDTHSYTLCFNKPELRLTMKCYALLLLLIPRPFSHTENA